MKHPRNLRVSAFRPVPWRGARAAAWGAARAAAAPGRAQFDGKMEELMRPFLDPAFAPADGPDADKAFILAMQEGMRKALPEKLGAAPAGKLRLLVLTQGTMGALHTPAAGGLLGFLREAAARYGAFELKEIYSDAAMAPEMLRGFDAVVLNNIAMAGRHEAFHEHLPDYVRNGGGLFAVHATALLYWKEADRPFHRLLGGYVDSVNGKYGHPLKAHGAPFRVKLHEPGHPILSAFGKPGGPMTVRHRSLVGARRNVYNVDIEPPMTLADELYVLVKAAGQEEAPRVLASVEKENAVQVYPETADDFAYALFWTKNVGKGRVFYSQFGHNMGVHTVPAIAETHLNGLLFAAGALAVP